MNDDNNDNVTPFRLVGKGDQEVTVEVKKVQSYYVEDIDGREYVEEGFCIFTAQHVAIMQEMGDEGAVPVLVIPLNRIKVVELIRDDDDLDDEDMLPF